MPAQPPPGPSPAGPDTRRRRRQQARAEQTVRPAVRHSRRLPPKRPAWQSPTAIVTVLAVLAAVILIIVVNVKPPASPAAVLVSPAKPVAASVSRAGAMLGSTSAPIKVSAWEDYQCPYCQVWSEQFEPQLVSDFVATGIAQYQFHDMAFLGTGHSPDESLAAAVAAQCAGDQNKFWEYHDWLYANQNAGGENKGWFTTDKLSAIALKVGLDKAAFDTCVVSPARAAAVVAERTAGGSLGINSTPTIFINDQPVTLSTYAALAAQIRALVPALPSGSAAPASPAAPGPSASP